MAFSSRVYVNENTHRPAAFGIVRVLKKMALFPKATCTLLLNLVLVISGIRSLCSVPVVIFEASKLGMRASASVPEAILEASRLEIL